MLVWLEPLDATHKAFEVIGRRFNADLQPIDDQPFVISAGPAPKIAPATIVTPNGVIIAYSRVDEANGGAPNIFMRTLDRLTPLPPQVPHRRTVR